MMMMMIIIIIMKADTNNHINGGKHYRSTERHIALTTDDVTISAITFTATQISVVGSGGLTDPNAVGQLYDPTRIF